LSIEVHSVVTGPFQENSYLIIDPHSRNGVCVDPGDESQLISNMIKDNDCTPVAIINTHAHLDHIGAVEELKNEYSIPFYLNENEKMVLDSYEVTCQMFQMPVKSTPTVDRWISNESDLEFDGLTFKVMFTPGHTPGGTTFIIENHVFVGDTLFRGSVGRTDLPGGNWGVLEESLMRMIEEIPSNHIVHSGHGPETSLEKERQENPFLIPLEKQLNSEL